MKLSELRKCEMCPNAVCHIKKCEMSYLNGLVVAVRCRLWNAEWGGVQSVECEKKGSVEWGTVGIWRSVKCKV